MKTRGGGADVVHIQVSWRVPWFVVSPPFRLGTPHAVAAVVAEVAVAVADGDGAAVVTTGGVELEAGELLAADGGAVAVNPQLSAGPLEQVGVGLLSMTIRAVRLTGSRSLACASGLCGGAFARAAGG
jgi:hypothetical protein